MENPKIFLMGKKRHITVTGKHIRWVEYLIRSCHPESSSSLPRRESEETPRKISTECAQEFPEKEMSRTLYFQKSVLKYFQCWKRRNITVMFKENKYYTKWIPLHELCIMWKCSVANIHYLQIINGTVIFTRWCLKIIWNIPLWGVKYRLF